MKMYKSIFTSLCPKEHKTSRTPPSAGCSGVVEVEVLAFSFSKKAEEL